MDRRRFLAALEGQPAFGFIGPNWFASVMGTGIVANAAATLPVQVPGLLALARTVWVLDVVLLVVITTATLIHWTQHPRAARGHLDDPSMSQFYGAPAMALMTVGAGALLVGEPVVGQSAAVGIDDGEHQVVLGRRGPGDPEGRRGGRAGVEARRAA